MPVDVGISISIPSDRVVGGSNANLGWKPLVLNLPAGDGSGGIGVDHANRGRFYFAHASSLYRLQVDTNGQYTNTFLFNVPAGAGNIAIVGNTAYICYKGAAPIDHHILAFDLASGSYRVFYASTTVTNYVFAVPKYIAAAYGFIYWTESGPTPYLYRMAPESSNTNKIGFQYWYAPTLVPSGGPSWNYFTGVAADASGQLFVNVTDNTGASHGENRTLRWNADATRQAIIGLPGNSDGTTYTFGDALTQTRLKGLGYLAVAGAGRRPTVAVPLSVNVYSQQEKKRIGRNHPGT